MATIPSESLPPRYLASSLGLVMGLGEIIGGVSAPTLAGMASDAYGLQASMLIMGGCAVVGGVLALFLKETAPVKVGAGAVPQPVPG
jgi:MFS family permease